MGLFASQKWAARQRAMWILSLAGLILMIWFPPQHLRRLSWHRSTPGNQDTSTALLPPAPSAVTCGYLPDTSSWSHSSPSGNRVQHTVFPLPLNYLGKKKHKSKWGLLHGYIVVGSVNNKAWNLGLPPEWAVSDIQPGTLRQHGGCEAGVFPNIPCSPIPCLSRLRDLLGSLEKEKCINRKDRMLFSLTYSIDEPTDWFLQPDPSFQRQ